MQRCRYTVELLDVEATNEDLQCRYSGSGSGTSGSAGAQRRVLNDLQRLIWLVRRHTQEGGCSIVYVLRRQDVTSLAASLQASGLRSLRVRGYHAGMSDKERKQVRSQVPLQLLQLFDFSACPVVGHAEE